MVKDLELLASRWRVLEAQYMSGGTPDDQGTRLRALARGRVQGVFFRDFARTHARRLGLAGWVRNLSDGRTVEIVAEGPQTSLEELLVHVRRGPPTAYVEHVEVQWKPAEGGLTPF